MKKRDSEENYTERLEKEIRELKAIKRHLEKRLKKLEKGYRKQEQDEILEESHEEEYREKNNCPSCSRGQIVETTLGIKRRILRCDICGWRKTEKI